MQNLFIEKVGDSVSKMNNHWSVASVEISLIILIDNSLLYIIDLM